MRPQLLTRYAWLSIAAAGVTISLKLGAYRLTGSVGLFSDALESIINFATALSTLFSLSIAAQPPDEGHAYGHTKAEYFASGLTGFLIFSAGIFIIFNAAQRWLFPEPLTQLGAGLVVSSIAALVNLGTARVLIQAGRRHHAIALTAEGRHLMSDVWTSAGVVLAIGLIWLTGWGWLDPLIALLVAAHLVVTALRLLRETIGGLMDRAIEPREVEILLAILERFRSRGVNYHAFRTRQAGQRRFVSVHLLVPGRWTVQQGHDVAEEIALEMRASVPNLATFTHLEPVEDPASWEDVELEPLSPVVAEPGSPPADST